MSDRDPRIKDLFEFEVDVWCRALAEFPGEVHAGIVHGVIKDVGFMIRGAVKHAYAFDILEVSERMSEAAKYLVPQKEIAFSILGQFAPPYMYADDQRDAMCKIVDQVEEQFGGAHDRLERRWKHEYEKQQEQARKVVPISAHQDVVAQEGLAKI